MKMYKRLLKVFFKEGFSFKKLIGTGNSKSKMKVILLGFAIVYGIASFYFAIGLLFYDLSYLFLAFFIAATTISAITK